MTRRYSVIAIAAVVVLSTVLPFVAVAGLIGTASGSETWIDVDACGVIDQPGNYQLSANLSANGNCIDIQTGGVTFDGNGYVIDGTGSGWAIDAGTSGGGAGVTVRDVTIRDFTVGISFYNVDNGEISGVTMEPENWRYPSVSSTGITLVGDSRYNVVHNNSLDRIGSYPAGSGQGNAINLENAHDNVIRDNDISAPSNNGIFLETARDNVLDGNQIWGGSSDRRMGSGIRLWTDANGTTLSGNYVYGGTTPNAIVTHYGIEVTSDANTLVGNEVHDVYYSGFEVTGEDNVLQGNYGVSNGEHGFYVSGVTGIDLLDNVATANGNDGYFLRNVAGETIRNNTAYSNSGWAFTLDSTPATVENLDLAAGGSTVSFTGVSASIEGDWFTPPADMESANRYVSVAGSMTLDVHYTDGQVADLTESDLSLWSHSAGSWAKVGSSVDTAANTVSASVGSGEYGLLANDTAAPTISNFGAIGSTPGELTIAFDASESLGDVEVTISNASGTVATLDRAAFQESGYGSYSYENVSALAAGTYDVTLVTAADAAGNDGASGQTATATVYEGLAVTSVDVVDAGDGDRIVTTGDTVSISATVQGSPTSVVADTAWFGPSSAWLSDPEGDGVYEGSFTVSAQATREATRYIGVTATDGNGQTASNNMAWLDLDVMAPYVEDVVVTDLEDGDQTVDHGDRVAVAVKVEDFSGVTVVANTTVLGAGYQTLTDPDGNGWYNGTVTVDAAVAPPDDLYYVWVTATDGAGNVDEGRSGYIILGTHTARPTATDAAATNLDGANDSVGDGDRITLSVRATAPFGIDRVSATPSDFGVDSVLLTDPEGDDVYEGTFIVDAANASIDGSYDVDLTVVGTRGRWTRVTTNQLTLVTPRDLSGPSISNETLSEPLEDGYVTGGDAVTVSATVTDAKSGVATVELDASALGAGTLVLTDANGDDIYKTTFTVDAAGAGADGYKSLMMTATDVDGNAANRWFSVRLDRSIASDATPPTINAFQVRVSEDRIVAAVNASEVLSDVVITIRNDSGGVVATLQDADIDGGSYGAHYRYFANHTPDVNGTYDVTLETAIDRAGNDGASGQTETVTVGGTSVGPIRPGTFTVSGQLFEADGTPAAEDGIILVNAADPTETLSATTDANGNYSVSIPNGTTVHVVYGQLDGSGALGPVDGSPDLHLLGTVSVDTDISRTLPAAHDVDVTVARGDTGAAVANATVAIAPGEPALLGVFRSDTDPQGRFVVDGTSAPGLEMTGTVHVSVEPPAGSTLSNATTSVDVTGPTNLTVTLAAGGGATPPPTPTPTPTPAPTPTPTPTPPASGGGSGGSGAVAPTPTPTPSGPTVDVSTTASGRTDVSVQNAANGTAVAIDVAGTSSGANAGGNVSLDGIELTPLVDGDFTVNVTVSETAPPGAPTSSPAGQTPIGYLNVDHSIADADIGEVTFRFSVSKASLSARGLAPADVVVYRYHDGQWEAASMAVVNETATHYTLTATVPGLSVFAVGTTPAATTDATPTASPTGTPTADATVATPSTSTDDGAADPPTSSANGPGLPLPVIVALLVAAAGGWALFARED